MATHIYMKLRLHCVKGDWNLYGWVYTKGLGMLVKCCNFSSLVTYTVLSVFPVWKVCFKMISGDVFLPFTFTHLTGCENFHRLPDSFKKMHTGASSGVLYFGNLPGLAAGFWGNSRLRFSLSASDRPLPCHFAGQQLRLCLPACLQALQPRAHRPDASPPHHRVHRADRLLLHPCAEEHHVSAASRPPVPFLPPACSAAALPPLWFSLTLTTKLARLSSSRLLLPRGSAAFVSAAVVFSFCSHENC